MLPEFPVVSLQKHIGYVWRASFVAPRSSLLRGLIMVRLCSRQLVNRRAEGLQHVAVAGRDGDQFIRGALARL